MMNFRCCAVVPTYDNPDTIRRVVERILMHVPDVFVVDDGSAERGRNACSDLQRDGLATVLRIETNRGKGVAVKLGMTEAGKAGFSHAFQIDADGQHDLDRIPEFTAAASASPDHAVFGSPIYDDSAPTVRRVARKITKFWVDLETGRGVIADAMVGFRVYPIAATLALPLRTRRMSFDVEVAVLLAWAGVPVLNMPVGIRYLDAEEGGLSHFRPFLDNVRMSWLHTRLCTSASIRWCLRQLHRPVMLGRS